MLILVLFLSRIEDAPDLLQLNSLLIPVTFPIGKLSVMEFFLALWI